MFLVGDDEDFLVIRLAPTRRLPRGWAAPSLPRHFHSPRIMYSPKELELLRKGPAVGLRDPDDSAMRSKTDI